MIRIYGILLFPSAQGIGLKIHEKGTLVTIEGPRFSTRAESKMFRIWGADIINMSVAPEVILANELGIPYAAIAMSTDYDCWKEDEIPVSWEDVIDVFNRNVNNVLRLITGGYYGGSNRYSDLFFLIKFLHNYIQITNIAVRF